MADPEIDAVHNCTPNFLHLSINKEIIKSGKHLLSEKPLCMNYEEAAELVELKKQYPDSVAAVNFNYRLNPLVQETKNRIAAGEIGDVRIMTGSYQQDWLLYDTDYSWRLEPEVSGISCAIADIGSHWMDAVQHVTGHTITEVMADLNTISPEARPYTALAMGHPEGWNDAFKGNIYAFYKYIEDGKTGEPVFSTLEQAAYIVKLTEAVVKSSKEKKWISVK